MTRATPETPPAYDDMRIVERPDGFYWRPKHTVREYGPFDTLTEAVRDMRSMDDQALEPGESLQEAESEVGIADWIDPETSEPAEENVPRLEQH